MQLLQRGQVFSKIHQKQGNIKFFSIQVNFQFMLLQSKSLPHQSLYAISVCSFFKITAADGNSCLKWNTIVLINPKCFQVGSKDGPTFRKDTLNCFSAFQAVVFSKLISLLLIQVLNLVIPRIKKAFAVAKAVIEKFNELFFRTMFVRNSQFMTTLCSAAGQNFTTIGVFHSCTESVY